MTSSADEPLTRPLTARWIDRPAGYRIFEEAFFVGRGRDTFVARAEELLHWQVKIRSGCDIDADTARVEAGQRPTIFVRLGPFRLPEPGSGSGAWANPSSDWRRSSTAADTRVPCAGERRGSDYADSRNCLSASS